MIDEKLREQAKKFALRCIRLARALSDDKIEQHIRIQLVTLSTSCAINIRACCISKLKNEMDEKLTAALEAIDGCCFWIECIITEGMKREGKVNPLLAEGLDLRNSIFNQLMKSENGKKRKNDINSGRK